MGFNSAFKGLKINWSIVSNPIHSQIQSCLQSAPSEYSVFGTNDGVASDISEHKQAASSSSASTIRFQRRFDQFHFRFRFIQRWQRNNGLLLVLHLVLTMLDEICESDDRTRVLLNCNDSQGWRRKTVNDKWPQRSSEIAHREMISCRQTTELGNASKFLYNLQWKWENQTEKLVLGLAEVREEV